MEVLPGQIWEENDNRFVRRVKVLKVAAVWVTIQNVATGRRSTASKSRFNGKKGGYALAEDTRE